MSEYEGHAAAFTPKSSVVLMIKCSHLEQTIFNTYLMNINYNSVTRPAIELHIRSEC